MGNCHSWRLDGPVVMQHHPRFHQPQTTPPQQETP
jgi:hypothetical protein